MPLRYWLLIIMLGAIWGCSFLFNAILIREISPLWVSAGRVTIGAAICWVYFLAMRKKLPGDWRIYAQLVLLGMFNYAIPFALFPYAEETVASSIVGVINGLTPMSTVIVSQLWPGGEKISWNKLVGVILGFFGAVILALPSFGAGASAQVLGLLAAMAATLCYAVALNYARRFRDIDSAAVATCSLTAAAVIAVPIALLFSGIPVITRLETWAALFSIAAFSTSFSFLLVYWLLPRVGATNISLNTFITPISAILLGVLVLHERFETAHVLGMIVIFIALIFMDGRLVRARRPISG
jgi:drug/metabolite transporter (DMT)-like permease